MYGRSFTCFDSDSFDQSLNHLNTNTWLIFSPFWNLYEHKNSGFHQIRNFSVHNLQINSLSPGSRFPIRAFYIRVFYWGCVVFICCLLMVGCFVVLVFIWVGLFWCWGCGAFCPRDLRYTNHRNKGLISVDRRTSLLSHLQYPVSYQSRLQRI